MQATDRDVRRSARGAGVGALAGALVGLVMVGYLFVHISNRPVGWASCGGAVGGLAALRSDRSGWASIDQPDPDCRAAENTT